MRFMMRLAGGAALAWIFLAQPALGATVSLPPLRGLLVYEASLGEINDVSIVEAPDNVFMITDLNAAIMSETTECVWISPNSVRCEVDSFVAETLILTKDGADSVDFVGGGALIDGGAGSDTLRCARGDASVDTGEQILAGGQGDDRLVGGRGTQSLSGGGGANSLAGGLGDDELLGGSGRDVLRGGAGDDRLYGRDGGDALLGGTGDDLLTGQFGADLILGGRGNDALYGGMHADDLGGGRGRDRLSGGSQNDILRGGPGRDHLLGDSGAEVLYARDRNRERVDGGHGEDRAHVDPIDGLFSVEMLF